MTFQDETNEREQWQQFQEEQQAERDQAHEDEYNCFMDAVNADDTETLAEIADNAFEYTEPAQSRYEITSDLLGDGEATVTEIADMVEAWEYEGWDLAVETSGDEVRVYATRTDDDADKTPSRHANWVMVTQEYGYLTVAVKK